LQAWIFDLGKKPALESVRLGLSHEPEFPDLGSPSD
jgi:hypothetical protein